MRVRYHHLVCTLFLLSCLLVSGCAMFHGWGQINSPGTPSFGASVDVPLGKK